MTLLASEQLLVLRLLPVQLVLVCVGVWCVCGCGVCGYVGVCDCVWGCLWCVGVESGVSIHGGLSVVIHLVT